MIEAPAKLADVVRPLGEEDFLALLRRREFAYLPGSQADRYAPLLGWQALRNMLASGDYPKKRRNDIRVTRESVMVPSERWTKDGEVDVARLDEFLANGFSVVVMHVDEHVSALASVCNEIKSRTLEGSCAGVIVTSGTARGAFKVHYDPEDLIILQVEGTKRWQVFGPAVPNPLLDMPKQTPPDTAPIFDEVLEPGDLLFLPGGNWHHCECGLSTSVHIGIFFLPPASWHAVNELVRPLISDEMFRRPLTRLDGPSALEAAEAELKRQLMDKISALNLSEFIAEWHKMAY